MLVATTSTGVEVSAQPKLPGDTTLAAPSSTPSTARPPGATEPINRSEDKPEEKPGQEILSGGSQQVDGSGQQVDGSGQQGSGVGNQVSLLVVCNVSLTLFSIYIARPITTVKHHVCFVLSQKQIVRRYVCVSICH